MCLKALVMVHGWTCCLASHRRSLDREVPSSRPSRGHPALPRARPLRRPRRAAAAAIFAAPPPPTFVSRRAAAAAADNLSARRRLFSYFFIIFEVPGTEFVLRSLHTSALHVCTRPSPHLRVKSWPSH